MKAPANLSFSVNGCWVVATDPSGQTIFMARADSALTYAEGLRKQVRLQRQLGVPDPPPEVRGTLRRFLDNAGAITRAAQIAKAGMGIAGPGPVPFIDEKFGIGREANENGSHPAA